MMFDNEVDPIATRRARRWFDARTFRNAPSLDELIARKDGARISVGIPALNEEATIEQICREISRDLMEETSFVDELVVLDGESIDETALRAHAAGARVVDVAKLLPDVPHIRGKGESLWRSLTHLSGDIIVWVDADIRNFTSTYVTSLVAPLLCDPSIEFVKGFYRRPLQIDGVLHPEGGGRVTELLARPVLGMLFPELAGFLQPLAGEYAGRAETFRRVPFFSGYSVEVGLLIDLLRLHGLDALAQVDLGTRVHRNRPLDELGPMAFGIARTIMQRAHEQDRVSIDASAHPMLAPNSLGMLESFFPREIERPPIETLRALEDVAAAR